MRTGTPGATENNGFTHAKLMPHTYVSLVAFRAASRFLWEKGMCEPPSAMLKGAPCSMRGNLAATSFHAACTSV